MQTKNQISLTRKALYGIMLLGVFLSAFGAGSLPSARAQEMDRNVVTNSVNENFAELNTTDLLEFQLISANQGWLAINNRLYWTDDHGGSWKNITPPDLNQRLINTVSFIDINNGWIILNNQTDPFSFAIERTIDNGTTWQAMPLDLFKTGDVNSPSDTIYMQWLDMQTGWLVVKEATSSNFSSGSLFKTTNGGKTWAKLSIPIGEPVYFITDNIGWVAGGADGSSLYQTLDGGLTWQLQTIVSTTDDGNALALYQLPKFDTINDGLIPVIIKEGNNEKVNFYSTSDGGQSWNLINNVPLGSDLGSWNNIPLKVIDTNHIVMILPQSNDIFRIKGKQVFETIQNEDGLSANIVKIDMVDIATGWAKYFSEACSPQATSTPGPVT